MLTNLGCSNAVDCLIGDNAMDGVDLEYLTTLGDFIEIGLKFSPLKSRSLISRLSSYRQDGVPLNLIDSVINSPNPNSPLTNSSIST